MKARAGEQTDDSTGLQYLRARYYDMETGRFISRDPMAHSPAWLANPFGYTTGNPVNATDPSGLEEYFDSANTGMVCDTLVGQCYDIGARWWSWFGGWVRDMGGYGVYWDGATWVRMSDESYGAGPQGFGRGSFAPPDSATPTGGRRVVCGLAGCLPVGGNDPLDEAAAAAGRIIIDTLESIGAERDAQVTFSQEAAQYIVDHPNAVAGCLFTAGMIGVSAATGTTPGVVVVISVVGGSYFCTTGLAGLP